MKNLIVATKSMFREYLFNNLLTETDTVVYESKKDYIVNFETKYLDELISEFIKNNFECNQSNLNYLNIENINSTEFLKIINNIGQLDRLIMTGANYLRKKQYIEVSKKIKTRLNIHMGDPNKFRGLDSNLWDMFKDKKSFPVVTLHHANLNLDTGEIIFQIKSKKTYEEITLEEFVSFEIEGAKKCLEIALKIKDITPVDSLFKNKGIYKGAMSSKDKHIAFKNLKSL